MSQDTTLPAAPRAAARPARLLPGILLVLASALVWSFGGAIARFIAEPDPWTVTFWRGLWAAAFLLGFMLLRDGPRGTRALILGMRLPALGVALGFCVASALFIVALGYTTVANIVLMLAGVPLIAALLARAFIGERIERPTWVAIAAVLAGMGIMVSEGLEAGGRAAIGSLLALAIAAGFAVATVITRAHREVRMVPAVWLGCAMSCGLGAVLADGFRVSAADHAWLFVFGALNLGLGMAFFVSGARRVPAALAALIGVAEPVLAPAWAWAFHGELVPARTFAGGAVVLAALVGHALWQALRRG